MKPELRYWDSACFLAVMKNEPESELCQGVIQAAEQGRVIIVTSTWTLTEVIRINTPMTKADDKVIRRFFERDYIALQDVTPEIGHLSRRLAWDHGYSTKDAIHVATALIAKCPVLDTLDGKLIRQGSPPNCDMRITEPDLPATQILPLGAELL